MDIAQQFNDSLGINDSTMVNMTSPPETGVNHKAMAVYNVYLCLVMLLGLPGNTLVLVVFVKHKPNTTTDWFILFITLCDFVTLSINVPVYITYSTGLWPLYGNTAICLVHMFVSQSITLSSSFLICGLAMDRYFRVCKPMAFYPTRRARNICITISIVTTLLSLPCFVLFENRQGSCRVSWKIELFIYYSMVFLSFVTATVIVVFSYIKVNTRIKETESSIAIHSNNRMALQNIKGTRIFVTGKRNRVAPSCETNIANNDQIHKHFVRFNEETNRVNDGCPVAKASTSKGSHSTNNVLPVTDKRLVSNNPSVSVQPPRTGYKQASRLTTKISFLVCGVFISSWIAPWTTFIAYSIGITFRAEVTLFARMTYLLNTASNPLLYTWLNRKFRNHMTYIVCFQR